MTIGGIAAEALRQFIERVERLEEEKKALQADIKDVLSQAKSQGFDTKIIRKLIALRKLDPNERLEQEQLLALYEAAIASAVPTARQESDGDDGPKDAVSEDERPVPPPAATITVEQAREMGRRAAEAGDPVTKNPLPARDPRRAAWDEEWCKAKGNDGMEIPEHLRRKSRNDKNQKDENGQ